ncbi:hypothetical protein [Brevundimonas sp.]|jgi:hypothetical protein|uniref:hypothetical protein n=1 Tax=Brevundimonas sp. TaxID=1871086 RepID=UPI0037C10929
MMDYWWILFPMAAFAFAGWTQWLNYRRQKALLDVVRTYADKGQEPPREILDALAGNAPGVGSTRQEVRQGTAAHYWSLVGLFGALCAGFAWASWGGRLDGGTGALSIVALVMGAVCLWSLICAVVLQVRGKRG